MEPRNLMVHAVIAIVEGPPAEELSGEIPRMIHGMVNVTAVVLQVVDTDDSPRCCEMRQIPIEKHPLPVQEQQCDGDADEHRSFNMELPSPGRIALSHRLNESPFAFQYRRRHGEEKEQDVQKVPAEPHLRRTHHISGTLDEFVVTEIMSGHEGADRVSVGQSKDDLKDFVESFPAEDGAVDCVMGDHRANPSHGAQGGDEPDGAPKWWVQYPGRYQ